MPNPTMRFDYEFAKAKALELWLENGIALGALRGKSRKRKLAWARQKLMYQLFISGKCSYPQIGYFLRRDWSTVMHGVKAHKKRNGIQ